MILVRTFGHVLRAWHHPALRPLRLGAPILWAAFIWFLSSREAPDGPPGFTISLCHNGGHAVLFGILSVLLLVAWPGRTLAAGWWWTSIGLAVAYGGIDELHQHFVPGRTCSLGDVMTDACGAAAGVAAIAAIATGRSRPALICAALMALAALSALVETLR